MSPMLLPTLTCSHGPHAFTLVRGYYVYSRSFTLTHRYHTSRRNTWNTRAKLCLLATGATQVDA